MAQNTIGMKTKNSAKFVSLLMVLALAYVAYYENAGKSACKGFASCFEASVDRVVDGDTLVIGNKTVRLALVNAPEKSGEKGREAENFTSRICPVNSLALVDEDDGQTSGSYDRMVAVVYCENKNLNELVLDNGMGNIYVSYCKTSEFRNEPWAKRHGC